jgi:hypothetical protein
MKSEEKAAGYKALQRTQQQGKEGRVCESDEAAHLVELSDCDADLRSDCAIEIHPPRHFDASFSYFILMRQFDAFRSAIFSSKVARTIHP